MKFTISDIMTSKPGTKVFFKGMVTNKILANKRNSSEVYLKLSIKDASGSIEFPVWDNAEELDKVIDHGTLVSIDGETSVYQGNIQVRARKITVLEIKDEELQHYIPAYQIPKELFIYFDNTLKSLKEPYKGFVLEITGYKEKDQRWNDYITCVAAENVHHGKLGGLFIHHIGVLKNIDNILKIYVEDPFYISGGNIINPDRMKALALTHDIGKIYEYEFRKGIYRKSNQLWDHRTTYITMAEDANNNLTEKIPREELDLMKYSVLSHHGPWGSHKPKTIEDTLLHLADMIDSKIVGCAEAGNEKEHINFSVLTMLRAGEY